MILHVRLGPLSLVSPVTTLKDILLSTPTSDTTDPRPWHHHQQWRGLQHRWASVSGCSQPHTSSSGHICTSPKTRESPLSPLAMSPFHFSDPSLRCGSGGQSTLAISSTPAQITHRTIAGTDTQKIKTPRPHLHRPPPRSPPLLRPLCRPHPGDPKAPSRAVI